MERYSGLLMESEMGELEEVEVAIACNERNQDQEDAADQGCSGLAIETGAGLGPAHGCLVFKLATPRRLNNCSTPVLLSQPYALLA